MTEQERLLLEQQNKQELPQPGTCKNRTPWGRTPAITRKGQRVSDAYKQYQGAVAAKPADYAKPLSRGRLTRPTRRF